MASKWNRDGQTTTQRGYGWRWQQTRLTILARDKHLCQSCRQKGRVTPAAQVDHCLAEARGGTDDPKNLQAICDNCHAIKTAIESAEGAAGTTHPLWLKPSAIPLTIVCGPPCAGKTTYVEKHAAAGDIVICFDMIATAIRPGYRHWTGQIYTKLTGQTLRTRNAMLATLATAKQDRSAWFIVSAPTAAERTWWQRKLSGDVLLLHPGLAECKRRALDRGTPLAVAGVDAWERAARLPWKPPTERKPKLTFGADGWPTEE